MPLMRDLSFVDDQWRRLADNEDVPHNGDVIVNVTRLDDVADRLKSQHGKTGLHVSNTVKSHLLQPLFNQVTLISVAFPAFNDGRGFSIAKRLRHLGFTGILRATGPLIADQYAYAKACGFDEIDLPETLALRQTADQWQKAANAISLSYQRGYNRPATILDQRRAKAS
jgi:uncharacterized protein (DUF934 family)